MFGHILRQKLAFPYDFEVESINQGVSITYDLRLYNFASETPLL